MLILNYSYEYKHFNYIYASSSFVKTFLYKVKIKAKIRKKAQLSKVLAPLFISFPGQAILGYWIIYLSGESAVIIRGALESNRTLNTYLKCLLVCVWVYSFKAFRDWAFHYNFKWGLPLLFFNFPNCRMLDCVFLFCPEHVPFCFVSEESEVRLIPWYEVPWHWHLCDILGTNLSMLSVGLKFHWGRVLSAEDYSVVVVVF